MENNKNSFEIIKQNRYEVMLNDFRESDIDFISESDYMYALEKAEVFTEAYFGKTKNILAIEKAMGELYEAMNAEPYKTHAGTPLARNLEKAIKDAFGFKKVVLNITTTMYDLPLVFTMADIERFSQASDIIISRKHGYYDSMGRHSVIIQISSTFASQYGLTAEEYTAMLLHEIGHSMDHTPYIALRTLLTIIANPFAILLSNRVTGGIFAAVVQWVSNIITSTPILSKINEWLTKAENIVARTAIPVLSVAALTAVPAAWAIGAIKLLRSAPGRKAEEFADSFAVSYGYGKELASALSKVDNRYTPNPRYNNALLNFMNDAGTAAGQILMIMSGDEHGTTTSRIRSMIDKAKRDLNRGNFNPEVKDVLIKDIEHLEREYDIIRGIYSVEGSNTPITDILRGFLDKVFRGYPHIFARGLKDTYVVPTTEAVEGETDLDKIMGLLAHMNDFKYGFATMSGKVFTGDILDKNDTFQTYYRTMPPNMAEKYQVAVCWDAVAYQANWFDANVPDISYKCYYCEYEPKIGNSHTWMVFTYQGKKYVFEWSWGSKRGVKVISLANKNTMDIYVEDIPKSDHSPTELKSGKYVVIEYDPHKDPYGCTTSEFMNNKWHKGHIIKTNCKSKQEMKLVFQLDGILEESAKDNIATIDFPNNESIEYAKNDSKLSRYVDTLIKDCVGEILVDKETEKMIGYAFVYGKKHKDHGFIFNVYLKPPYRGRGLGKKLVLDAIHKYDGVDLTVKKNNDHAVDLYKKNGFVIIGDGNSKSEYYMKLKSKLTKDDVSKIIDKIHDKVNKDKKKPTGNQNCMLCTWCLEAQLRGIDILPRPVYSPSDKIFSLDPIGIFNKPTKQKFNSISKVKSIVKSTGDNSRYYCHVNWKDSEGGHEFLVLNLNDGVYVSDGQAGVLSSIDSKAGKEYFDDINYSNSYIVRVDNIILNKDYLKYNDNKYILDWDEERDSKLVSESANNKIGTLHRYTYNGTGIYEALKRAVDMDTWKSLLQSGDINWLPKPPKYASGYASWFSDEGNKEFKKRTLPIIQKYLDKDKIKYITLTNPPSSVIYKDKYQIVVDPDDIFEESVVTESVVFNKKDIYRNLGKFKTGESNILLITGYSGSGKSTLAEGLSKQYKCGYIELDVLDFYIHRYITLDKVKEFEPALFDYIESKGDKFIKNYPGDVYADYIPFVIDWCERHPDRKFIVEGLQLYEIFNKDNPQEFFKKCPIIIKGTSGVVSSVRGAKRNDGNSLKNFVYLLKWVLKDTRQLNNLTKFYSESVTETYGKVWMRMNRIYDID